MITNLVYNWRFSPENGEEFNTFDIGYTKGLVEITEHRAQGEGDKWYYDAIFEDGKVIRVFNPNQVQFNKENQ